MAIGGSSAKQRIACGGSVSNLDKVFAQCNGLAIHAPVKSPDTGRTGSILMEVIEYVRVYEHEIYRNNFRLNVGPNIIFTDHQNSPVRPSKLIVLIQKSCTRTIDI
jgi:hypothetical protein